MKSRKALGMLLAGAERGTTVDRIGVVLLGSIRLISATVPERALGLPGLSQKRRGT